MSGGPAFPTPAHNLQNDGMTLRDYFAAKAMQGLLSDPDWRQDTTFEDTAYAAYEQADAMLEARDYEHPR
jgi:hypothetical protein